jgi:hypothetical protein
VQQLGRIPIIFIQTCRLAVSQGSWERHGAGRAVASSSPPTWPIPDFLLGSQLAGAPLECLNNSKALVPYSLVGCFQRGIHNTVGLGRLVEKVVPEGRHLISNPQPGSQ